MNWGAQIGEYFRFAWESIKANKIRSFLTTLGILIGVTTIILIFTLIQSINAYVTSELSNIASTTVYVSKFPWVITGNYWELRNRPPVTLKDYKEIRDKSTYARWIAPIFESMRTIQYGSNSLEQVFTIGTNEEYVETDNLDIDIGRWFTPLDVRNGRSVSVIGQTIWEELFHGANPIGKRIKINGFPYKVIGVLEKRGNFFGFNMDNQVIIPYTVFRGFSIHRRGISIAVKAADPAQIENMKDEIRGILRKSRKIPPREKDNFAINEQNMLVDFYRKITSTSYLVIFVVGAISLIVGGIGIMNIMLVSVTERTREIGIRKAVGASRRHILMQFLFEAVSISSIGGILGVGLGVAISQIPLNLLNLNAAVSVWTIVIGFGFSTFVGVVSGIYPAHKAANLNPIEALRYE